jgi:glucosyl-dolichyl phosphate glucuronosyltransferase
MPSRPRLSVVVCTCNRPDLVARSLGALLEQTECSSGDYEIIIVDNFPNKDVHEVVQTTGINTRVAVRYVVEAQAGVSHARNRGWREATADLVGFVDDDAFAATSWVAAVLAAFERYPECDAIGGKVLGAWEATRPDWLHDDLLSLVSLSNYGERFRILEANEYPIGANMIFRRQALETAGTFSVNLGRVGNNLLALEEVDLCYQLRKRQKRIFYAPEAEVSHVVPAARLTRRYLIQRTYWNGHSLATWHRLRMGRATQILQASLRTFGAVPRNLLFWLIATIRRSPGDRFLAICLTWKSWGYLRQTCSDLLQFLRPERANGRGGSC